MAVTVLPKEETELDAVTQNAPSHSQAGKYRALLRAQGDSAPLPGPLIPCCLPVSSASSTCPAFQGLLSPQPTWHQLRDSLVG